MTDPILARAVFWIAIGMISLAVAFRYLWVPACLDSFRQHTFFLRHQLFIMMADGRVEATGVEYVHLRTLMNGWLRYAERATIFRALVANHLSRTMPSLPRPPSFLHIVRDSSAPEDVKRDLYLLHVQLIGRVIILAILRSPLLWFTGFVFGLVFSSVRRFSAAATQWLYSKLFGPMADEAWGDAEMHAHGGERNAAA